MRSGETYAGKAVLITGGLGFIGSNLALRLVELGARVTLVDRMTESDGGNTFNIDSIKSDVETHINDVADDEVMATLIRGKDYLFNLAGKVSHLDSMLEPKADLHANVTAQISQLEACRRYNPDARIVFASTRQIYGRPQYLPVDERHPIAPVDVNGIHKRAAESLHLLYSTTYGLRTTSLRLTNTYGPRQLLRHSRLGFAGWFVGLALRGMEIQLFGDGCQRRDFTYVDDVVDAFLLAGASDSTVGQALNVGNPEPVALIDFVRILIDKAGAGTYKLVPFPDERKRIDIGDVYTQSDLFTSLTGWKARVSLRDGLARTVAYFENNASHYFQS
jgi:UDP-glucose 4-epimerase